MTVWAILVLTSSTVLAENWPAWRGARGNGISSETNFPTHWTRQQNIRWKVALPEPGNSTPIVWGDKVFVTQPAEGGQRRTIICFDRETGQQLWQSGVDAAVMERKHQTNTYCAPSPVTDGERVIAWFGSAGLVAFDLNGKQLWRRPLGRVEHVFGYGASPVLHGDLCFLNFGPGTREFAIAVHKHTGDVVWQLDAPRPSSVPPDLDGKDIYGTWSTPLVANNQVIFCFRDTITALEPTTGGQIWTCRGLGPQMKSSPFVGDGVVVALGGKDSSTLAIKLGGTGDISQSHVLWKYPRASSRLGTGVIHEGHLYANQSNGIIDCIELETGKEVWKRRHRATGSSSASWSSLFLAGDKIYAMNQSADVFVLQASPDYNLIATNSLDSHTNSSVVGSQGNLFIRTDDALWCVGE